MPAAAVIPAPIAYIKVAAVKKLVVGFQSHLLGPLIKGTAVYGRDLYSFSGLSYLSRITLSWWLLL